MPDILELNEFRTSRPDRFDDLFRGFHDWEFATPTYPFIYFLDTRTKRTYRDGFNGFDRNAPAYLKNGESWASTWSRIKVLQRRQSREYPLVVLAPGPVFGFETIDKIQKAVSGIVGPNFLDFESWAANPRHLLLFLTACGDQDVVIISGDVHYAYTSTVTFSNFDDEFFRAASRMLPNDLFPVRGSGPNPTYQFLYASRYLQLTSSAAKNFADIRMKNVASASSEYAYLFAGGKVGQGIYKDGKLKIVTHVGPGGDEVLKEVKPEEIKLGCALLQQYNNVHNSPYVADHNIGFVQIDKRKVKNGFLVKSKLTSRRTWDFANGIYWPR